MSVTPISSSSNAGTITSLGSGSGLNLQGILDQLQTADSAQLTIIQNKESSVQTQISAFGTLQSAIQSVADAAATLANRSTYSSVKSSVSGSAVSVTTSNGASAGTYDVEVTQLAKAERLASASAVSTKTGANGTGGSVTIKLADGTSTNIDVSADTSLQGVADAINKSDAAGVNATIVNGGNNQYYLLLTSSTTGTDKAISNISISGNSTLSSILSFDSTASSGNALNVQQSAANASFTLNGITINSQTNTVSNAVDNVTFTLNQVSAANSPDTVTITDDPSVTVNAVQAFVNAYNTMKTTVSALTSFDTSAGTSSPLTGDSTTRNAQNALASALQVYMGSQANVQSLADLGITINTNASQGALGSLTLDTATLTNALTAHPSEVINLLSGTGGLASTVMNATNAVLGSGSDTGAIGYATQGLQDTLTELQNQYTSAQSRITDEINNYRIEFTNLDTLIAQMNSTGSYLTQQFAAMSSSSSSK
jgi:flagellar hook-associated protein 2